MDSEEEKDKSYRQKYLEALEKAGEKRHRYRAGFRVSAYVYTEEFEADNIEDASEKAYSVPIPPEEYTNIINIMEHELASIEDLDTGDVDEWCE